MKKTLTMTASFILFSVFLSGLNAVACDKPADPNKVVLFVDLNRGSAEVTAARSGACERGETFVVLGDPPPELQQRISALERKVKAELNQKCNKPENTTDCDALHKTLIENSNALDKAYVEASQQSMTADGLKAYMTQLAQSNKALSALIISGHDGGGEFTGEDFSKSIKIADIYSGIHSAYDSNEALLNQLDTVVLLGCYSGTTPEVSNWKANLPNLRILGGYVGYAPASSSPSSGDLARDILMKGPQILEQHNSTDVKKAIAGITDINVSFSAVYVDTCDNQEFYYSNANPHPTYYGAGTIFRNYFGSFAQFSKCQVSPESAQEMNQTLQNYRDGNTPIPKNTDSGPLRDVYTFARQNAGCFEKDQAENFNGDGIGLLLFYDGVKKNFATVFKDLIQKTQSELSAAYPKVKALDNKNPDVENLRSSFDWFARKNWQLSPESLDRIDVNAIITTLDSFQNNPYLGSSGIADQLKSVKELAQKMSEYLYTLDRKCMDFLDWHEFKPGFVPKPLC